MLKKIIIVLSFILSTGLLQARNQAFEHVNVLISIPSVSYISVNQNHVDLDLQGYQININQEYRPYIEKDITYNILVAGTNKRLVAQLTGSPMPTGTMLEIRANPPPSATSHGYVNLSPAPQPIISNISNVQASNLEMRFRLRAELGAPIIARDIKTVRLTIMD